MKKFALFSTCAMTVLLFGGIAFSASYTKLDASGQPLANQLDTNHAMVKDTDTDLIWEVKTSANSGTYCSITPNPNTGAPLVQGRIDELNASPGFGGYTDWRLPTIKELASIVDLGKASAPAINVSYFPNMKTNLRYWTSTDYALSYESPIYTDVWTVWFNSGIDFTWGKAGSNYFIAVRGVGKNMPNPRFVSDDAKGIVTDNLTGLVWEKSPRSVKDSVKQAWGDASAYCGTIPAAKLTATDCYGWRLPTREELRSIINYERYQPQDPNPAPAIHTGFFSFSASQSSPFWTFTPNAQNSAQAWYIDVWSGSADAASKTDPYYVWAVLEKSVTVTCPTGTTYFRGDINHDTKVDLADVISALQILAGLTPDPTKVKYDADTAIPGDTKIGHEEAIYVLQVVAGLR